MKKIRYLIIGDANSMHIYNYVKTVLVPRNMEIHLLTLSTLPIRKEYRDYYEEKGIFIHSISEKGYKNLNKKDILHRGLQLFEKMLLMMDVPKVDICHVHSVYKTSMYMIRLFRFKFQKLILSYWGGDIEDLTPSVIKLREQCFKMASSITVTVKRTKEQFQELYGHKYDSKLHICRFATAGLECIRSIQKTMTRMQCRDVYHIPKGKICITCGYSAYEAQHQDICLKQIGKLPVELKKQLYVVIPMQYGRFDLEYIDRVKKNAREANVSYEILEEYVSFRESAMLAIATDIYLHVRDTDAFSNALKEHIYASSIVIKGDWLVYRELDEMHADVKSISSLEQIAEMLTKVIKENDCIKRDIVLFEPIYQLYSIQNIVSQWNYIINKTLEV
ncbi:MULTISPECIES: hypothetical protein [Eubacteriales]|uniref:hypothetical protein n=1 Tax=Eubacteriales TaxID=186802 RepID=UPI0011065525|nr:MULTISPECIES: hypothetical protein [Eubacteriales]